ncbi:MAG: hypothetical protein DRQ46_03410 [Gammaproteobacteria bacterium]|nr:MAG: hypothetical protein DRQ46_03410 [Gammaproteobacteria bacterium]
MSTISNILCGLLMMLFSIIGFAETIDQEMQHLLQTIGNSDCIFVRNSKEYSPQEARAHIQRKYNYIKSKITTTEQAIKYAATESSWSGKLYQIKCPGKNALPSGQWLTQELINYRTQY